jgi:23S rRNA (guanosine2251-2'-O)-methyltransferase
MSKNINQSLDIYTIYGINNCHNFLLYNSIYSLKSIFIDKNSKILKDSNLKKMINNFNNYITLLSSNDFNNKFSFKHSQGIIIEFSGDLYSELYDIKNFKDNHCILIGDQINDPQNLGQIIRTSECAGVDGIILPQHRSVHLTNTVLQISQGAFMHTNIYIETNIVSSIEYLKSKGFWIIGLENSINSKQWYDIDYKGKVAIVVGSEGYGIRELVKKSCDFLTTIKMNGKINSLNVSAAVSTILFERQRQLIA